MTFLELTDACQSAERQGGIETKSKSKSIHNPLIGGGPQQRPGWSDERQEKTQSNDLASRMRRNPRSAQQSSSQSTLHVQHVESLLLSSFQAPRGRGGRLSL